MNVDKEVIPQFNSDVLGCIMHIVVDWHDCLWHCLYWPMIRAMTPYILRSYVTLCHSSDYIFGISM
jgi:hypothetical protein